MSWLRDPETGELAKPLNQWELMLLAGRAGRQHQPQHGRWVVKRDRKGTAKSIELNVVPNGERGVGGR